MKKRYVLSAAITVVALLNSLILLSQNTSPYWSLAGNSNTTSTSKFGTTNAIDLRIFTTNVERMRVKATDQVCINTIIPRAILDVNSANGENPFRVEVKGVTKLLVHYSGGVAIGGNLLPPVNGLFVYGNTGLGTTTPGAKLHVVGKSIFTDDAKINGITVGRGNGGVEDNTVVGNGALNANTTGFANTALGFTALYNNTTGFLNTAVGYYALNQNTTGHENIAVGDFALNANTTGNGNTATGDDALSSNISGEQNTATGIVSLISNTTGNRNTASEKIS
ncbi:MAG: hypothetical protein ABIN97_07755 [Ginsengibacter sp.]